ncbi:putative ankyrin repeat protein RF_0381 isoform X2 [Microplitis demolitor]|nr:putative ankyrin repeat protein RF_0381 isoform X2 [Microplitis demolitor]
MAYELYREMRDKVKTGLMSVNQRISLRPDNPRLTTLLWAIEYNDNEFIEYLLNHKDIKVNLHTEGYGTALHYAIDLVNDDVVCKLVNAGANVNLKSRCRFDDIYPLDMAVERNQYRIAQFLINHGATVNNSSSFISRLLSIPVRHDNENLVKLLIENCPDVNERSEYYESLLINAIRCQSNKVFRYLLERDIDPNSSDNVAKITLLHIAADNKNAEAVELLLNHDDIDVNRLTANRNSVIDYAFLKDNFVICKSLLRAGIDFNKVKDHYFDDTRNNYLVISLIRQHIVKMNAAKMYNMTEKLNNVLNTNEYANDFSKKCYDEVKFLKICKVSNSSMSFYTILQGSVHRIANFLIYADIDDNDIIFDDQLLIQQFPLYGEMISFKLHKSRRRKNLLKNLYYCIFDIFKNKLPDLVVDNIMRYFSNRELRHLNEKYEHSTK